MRSILLAVLLSAPAAAQCPFSSVSLQSQGNGCTTVFNQPTTLAAALDATSCTLGVTVQSFSGCCNTFLTARMLALGVRQIRVPLPFVGANCTLLVDPAALLLLPAAGGDTFTFNLPATLPSPLSFEAQGAALYVTFGVTFDWQLTAGGTILLQ